MNPEDEPQENRVPAYRDPSEPYRQYPDAPEDSRRSLYPAAPSSFPGDTQRAARALLRRAGNRAALIPLLTILLQFLCGIVFAVVWAVVNLSNFLNFYRQGGVPELTKYLASQMGTILFLIYLSVILAMALSVLIGRSELHCKIRSLWKRPSMTAPGFAKAAVAAFGVAGVAQLFAAGLEQLCKATGLKITAPDLPMTGGTAANIVLFAYVCVLGPIFEETLFRGMILQSLRPWGDRLAVVVSAVLFGLTHLNLYQGVPAVLLGLVFGLIAVRAGSVIPSAVLHIAYNSLTMILAAFGLETNSALQTAYFIFLGAAVLGTVFLLATRRIDFRTVGGEPAPGTPEPEHPYRTVFLQSAAFWVLAACFVAFGFLLTGMTSAANL